MFALIEARINAESLSETYSLQYRVGGGSWQGCIEAERQSNTSVKPQI